MHGFTYCESHGKYSLEFYYILQQNYIKLIPKICSRLAPIIKLVFYQIIA